MARILLLLAILISSTVIGQTFGTQSVQHAIDTFFEGFHKGDTALMKTVMMNKFPTQTTYKNGDGKDVLKTSDSNDLLLAIAQRPEDQKWEEKLLDYVIKVDGNMAMAWTPYEFWFNGKFSHCGVNSFQLFHDNGQWKITSLIDSRRQSDCKSSKN